MLNRLSIRNYALIDTLDIQFDGGLNILTGETGAGKSIIMGGLSLILGQRAEGRHFFDAGKKCVIEGYFDVTNYQLTAFFDDQDLDYEKETIIRREISPDGKSRAFVNDTPVTLQTLKALAERLIDIHSQHATLQLNTEAFQLLTLDSIARNGALRQAYATCYQRYKAVQAELEALEQAARRADAEADYHQYVHDELAKADLQHDEQERLETERSQLEHAEEIKRGLLGAVYGLQDQEMNALALLKESLQHLQQAERYMPALAPEVGRLQGSVIELKDLAGELARHEQGVVLDEGRLATVNERLDMLYLLLQKHRAENVAALIDLREELREKLERRMIDEDAIARLKGEAATSRSQLVDAARQLSDSRKAIIPTVSGGVEALLRSVGMPHSKLEIDLEALAEEAMRDHGLDRVTFRFSANKGQPPQPVGKVASGGELSRLMLAIKSLVAKTTALPTIIFDEIDTGISGEVALRVGEVMERMADHMQVIAITHLPQIASRGTSHFKVYKQEIADKTVTQLVQLDQQERITEIAQMLSGANPGEAAVQHAAELLEGSKTGDRSPK